MTAFLKMNGLGNDFAVFDARNQPLALDTATARALADRRFGVGCDQVIVIERATNGADAFMRIYNSDGGEVESCGNAARCIAGLLLGEKDAQDIKLDTTGGALVCKSDGANVSIDMGVPKFGWRDIPLAHEIDAENFSLHLPGTELPAIPATVVNVGNPHVVLFVDDADAAPVAEAGPNIETHPLFPQHTNVEFVSLIDKNKLRMRVWERGVGITMACGTGACAAMVAAHRRGLVGHKAEVVLDGGSLTLEWAGEGKPVIMTGPWSLSYKGDVDLKALRR